MRSRHASLSTVCWPLDSGIPHLSLKNGTHATIAEIAAAEKINESYARRDTGKQADHALSPIYANDDDQREDHCALDLHLQVRHSPGMKQPAKIRAPVLAAGGIVVREASLIAVVRLRKDKSWVLPKGKLKPGEDALAGARREVMEETGYDVSVQGFLGTMSHAEGGKLKVVQFWRMRATGNPARKLMDDVTAVKWLPLQEAVDTLTRPHEKAFLMSVGQAALQAADPSARDAAAEPAAPPVPDDGGLPKPRTFFEAIRAWLRRLT